MKKRMIALLLCAALLCALLTQMVSAAETTEIVETDEEIRVKQLIVQGVAKHVIKAL